MIQFLPYVRNARLMVAVAGKYWFTIRVVKLKWKKLKFAHNFIFLIILRFSKQCYIFLRFSNEKILIFEISIFFSNLEIFKKISKFRCSFYNLEILKKFSKFRLFSRNFQLLFFQSSKFSGYALIRIFTIFFEVYKIVKFSNFKIIMNRISIN